MPFEIGGLICVLGQLIQNGFAAAGLDKTDAGTATSMSLVVLSVLLTGFSLYDDLAKVAGPVRWYPLPALLNSIAAPAIEFRSERNCHRHLRQALFHCRSCAGIWHFSQRHLRPDLLAEHQRLLVCPPISFLWGQRRIPL